MREVQAIAQIAPAELEIGRGKYGDDRDEDADMSPVHLPDAVQDARRPERPAGAVEHAPEGERRGDAGAEDEDLGCVREAEARRDPVRPCVPRDMGDEDDEHPDAAEDVEPRVARTLGFGLGTAIARSILNRRSGRLLAPLDHGADDETEDDVTAAGRPGERDEVEEGGQPGDQMRHDVKREDP